MWFAKQLSIIRALEYSTVHAVLWLSKWKDNYRPYQGICGHNLQFEGSHDVMTKVSRGKTIIKRGKRRRSRSNRKFILPSWSSSHASSSSPHSLQPGHVWSTSEDPKLMIFGKQNHFFRNTFRGSKFPCSTPK